MSLREVQGLFHRLVTAPENVTRMMETLGIPEGKVHQAFRGDQVLSPVARLDIYADMYFFRIRDVLKELYERVFNTIGEEAFHNLIVEYLIAYPPRTPSIRDAGDRLPLFLQTHELTQGRPWLPDLAQLEAFRLDVFDAEDATFLTIEKLRATPPDAFADVPLRLVPAQHFLPTPWAVETDDPQQRAEGEAVLIWRNGFDADQRRPDPLESEALRLVAQGTTFGAVCELIATRTSEEEAPAVAFQLLNRWISDGLISDEQA